MFLNAKVNGLPKNFDSEQDCIREVKEHQASQRKENARISQSAHKGLPGYLSPKISSCIMLQKYPSARPLLAPWS